MKAQDLIKHHDPSWRKAIRHPFLDGVREGTLPEGVFERWLVQDYLFVLDGLAFQSRLIPRAIFAVSRSPTASASVSIAV